MRRRGPVIVALIFCIATSKASAQGFSPAESERRMTVQDGLASTLFASEPMVSQSTFVKCDDRGRLWTIQYLQYPNPAGLKRVSVDRYSRTVYETAAETNAEVKKVFEKQASELNKTAVTSLEEAFKYAPAGSEAYVGNVKSAIAAAQNAYENLASINKQLVESVEKTVEQNVATVKAAAAPKARRTTKRK